MTDTIKVQGLLNEIYSFSKFQIFETEERQRTKQHKKIESLIMAIETEIGLRV